MLHFVTFGITIGLLLSRLVDSLHRDHMAEALARARQQMKDAETWPGFTERREAIVSILKRDRSLSLRDAYEQAARG